MSFRQHFVDFIERTFGDWLDLRQLWKDRQSIVFNPMEALDGNRPPNDRPWPFAVKALLLPAGIVAAVVTGFAFFLQLPPTGIEQAIAEQQRMEVILADAVAEFKHPQPSKDRKLAVWTDQQLKTRLDNILSTLKTARAIKPRSPELQGKIDVMRQEGVTIVNEQYIRTTSRLAATFAEAQQRSLRTQAFLKALQKLNELTEKFRFAILGATLLLNALTFRWFIFRRKGDFAAPDSADSAHLYLTGAALLLPNFAIGMANILIDWGVRYQLEWLPRWYQILSLALAIWFLLSLRAVVPVLTQQLQPAPTLTPRRARRLVANRLVMSNIISFLVVNVIVALIGVPILFWFIQHPT